MKINPVSFYLTPKNKTNFNGFADDNARQVVTTALEDQKTCYDKKWVDYIENDTFTTVYTDKDGKVVGKINQDLVKKANNENVTWICDEMKDVLEDLSIPGQVKYLAIRIKDINYELDGTADAIRKYAAENPSRSTEPQRISNKTPQELEWEMDAMLHP